MTTVLFWDIDGTLLNSGGAGRFALSDAASALVDVPNALDGIEMAGMTDWGIAIQILNALNIPADKTAITALLQQYLDYLPARLASTSGYVLGGVKEILEQLQQRQDVISLLLTGNSEAGAWTKLTHYGLDDYFSGGAFCQDSSDRHEIARQALALAHQQLGTVSPEKCYVIGDTPHDIRCGQAIGARTIAIASGRYSVTQLASHDSWLVWEDFPEPSFFIAQIGLE